MFREEYIKNGLDRVHCRFIFRNGDVKTGSLARHFKNDPENFYFVDTNNINEFLECRNKYEETSDEISYMKMNSLAIKVDMDTLTEAVIVNN